MAAAAATSRATATEQPSAAATATAKMRNLSISTKHAAMVCRSVRYKNTSFAKKLLEEVIALRRPIPYPRSNFDLGHRPGIGPGRYPQKAARGVLQLIKSVEANAQSRGLNTANLKITKLMAHKAALPFTGGRWFHRRKRSHLEIEVQERTPPEKPEKQGKQLKGQKSVKPRL